MKRKLYPAMALLLAIALLLLPAACGGKAAPASARETEALTETAAATTAGPESEEEGTTAQEAPTTAPDGSSSVKATAAGETSIAANAVPATPAEVLSAYTEVMNYAKKNARHMRKLEYQQLGKDHKFESDSLQGIMDNDTVMEQAGKLMTSREAAMEKDMYTQGVSDMVNELPIMKCNAGCMVKDVNAFTLAAARQLSNGNIELTLVMKEENNPEPAAAGASTAPSITGQMFNPLSKAGIDERLNGTIVKMAFFGKPPVIGTKYYGCKAVLTYDPATSRIVSLQHNYNVRINVLEGKALGFINTVGYATLEAAMVCDNFRY